MPKFMCITTCVLNKKTLAGQPYPDLIMEGQTITAKEQPNHHFVKLDGDLVDKNLQEILLEKLSEYDDIYIDEKMDVPYLQGLLANKRQEEAEKDEVEVCKTVLRNHGIKFHHKLGAVRLQKLITQHNLEKELREEQKVKDVM